MKPKLKADLDLDSIQSNLIETICSAYTPGVSVRALARQFDLSPMKVRKILITGGCYSTDVSTEVDALYKDGKTVREIAALLNMTTANVNSMLPYERIIYNMEERSVEADRQQRYRDRKAGKLPVLPETSALPQIERVRNKTLVVVIGRKLRRILPEIMDDYSDPLSRDITSWGEDQWNPKDPARNIWCAEVTTSGRGKEKKQAIILESANCGFTVMCPFPQKSVLLSVEDLQGDANRTAEQENRKKLKEYRVELETLMLSAIRDGMIAFSLPEDRIQDYTDTIARIELVKGKPTTPQVRLEELIARDLKWEKGQDPLEHFNIRGNFTSRKFGNSPWYRRVDEAVCEMLYMNDEEQKKWIDQFMEPFGK